MADYHSVEELDSHFLVGQWGLSHRKAWRLMLGLCVQWGRKPPDTTRIAKHGALVSLGCMAVGYWHWAASWGWPSGREATRLELSGAHNAAEALGSTWVGVWISQEPCQLLQEWGIQTCWQQEVWGLLARYRPPGATGANAVTGEQSLWAVGALEPACWCKLQEGSTVALQAWGNQIFG
jgi:hypothetical protein